MSCCPLSLFFLWPWICLQLALNGLCSIYGAALTSSPLYLFFLTLPADPQRHLKEPAGVWQRFRWTWWHKPQVTLCYSLVTQTTKRVDVTPSLDVFSRWRVKQDRKVRAGKSISSPSEWPSLAPGGLYVGIHWLCLGVYSQPGLLQLQTSGQGQNEDWEENPAPPSALSLDNPACVWYMHA